MFFFITRFPAIRYTPVTIPIPCDNFPDYVEQLSRDNNRLLEEEFRVIQNLSEVTANTTDTFSHPDNQPKNRYTLFYEKLQTSRGLKIFEIFLILVNFASNSKKKYHLLYFHLTPVHYLDLWRYTVI